MWYYAIYSIDLHIQSFSQNLQEVNIQSGWKKKKYYELFFTTGYNLELTYSQKELLSYEGSPGLRILIRN